MVIDEEIATINIEWEGVDLSLNKWSANRHWSFRNKEKEFWANLFLKLLPKRTKKIDSAKAKFAKEKEDDKHNKRD